MARDSRDWQHSFPILEPSRSDPGQRNALFRDDDSMYLLDGKFTILSFNRLTFKVQKFPLGLLIRVTAQPSSQITQIGKAPTAPKAQSRAIFSDQVQHLISFHPSTPPSLCSQAVSNILHTRCPSHEQEIKFEHQTPVAATSAPAFTSWIMRWTSSPRARRSPFARYIYLEVRSRRFHN